jgi:anti-anti-sigma factor
MEIAQDVQGGVIVVTPTGRIDTTASERFSEVLAGVLAAGHTQVVIDFAGVDYISSAGLAALVVTAKRLGGGKGRLVLSALRNPVRQVLELTGLIPVFTIEASREAALSRLAPPTP